MNTLTVAIQLLAWMMVGLASTAYASAQTLGDALTKRGVPLDGLPPSDRSRPIMSYAESKDEEPYLVAYYDDDGSGMLQSPLHVLRYDNAAGLERTDLIGADGPFSGVMHEPNSQCFGSVLEIQQTAALIYIETHINPSAGCVLVFSQELKFKVALEGWVLGMMGRIIILHGNEVHFTDTHPSSVAVYDLQSDKLTQVYPPKDDPRRKAFSAALASRLPEERWCRQENKACDPETFTSNIGDVTADDLAHSFSFTATLYRKSGGMRRIRCASNRGSSNRRCQ
jgi:hypothetical protein